MPSKLVTDREKSSLLVEKAAAVHAEAVAAALDVLFAPALQPGEQPPDFRHLLNLAGRTIAEARQRMVAADDAQLAELADDREPRRRRNEAARHLHEVLLGVRKAFDSLYAPLTAVEVLGLDHDIAVDPVRMRRQAVTVLERLRNPSLTFPQARYQGLAVQPANLADEIAPALAALEQTLDVVAQEKREAEATLAAKNDAIAANDAAFTRMANFLSALFAAANRPELARKVRPSTRRPGRTAEPPEESPEPTLPPPTAPEEPASSTKS
jgi:hypothetical protein